MTIVEKSTIVELSPEYFDLVSGGVCAPSDTELKQLPVESYCLPTDTQDPEDPIGT
jgi:hypothetical protein